MLKRTGQESLLNRTMAPSGVVCVAAQDGLWMMGSGGTQQALGANETKTKS